MLLIWKPCQGFKQLQRVGIEKLLASTICENEKLPNKLSPKHSNSSHKQLPCYTVTLEPSHRCSRIVTHTLATPEPPHSCLQPPNQSHTKRQPQSKVNPKQHKNCKKRNSYTSPSLPPPPSPPYQLDYVWHCSPPWTRQRSSGQQQRCRAPDTHAPCTTSDSSSRTRLERAPQNPCQELVPCPRTSLHRRSWQRASAVVRRAGQFDCSFSQRRDLQPQAAL